MLAWGQPVATTTVASLTSSTSFLAISRLSLMTSWSLKKSATRILSITMSIFLPVEILGFWYT